ncbi:MAG: NACHT domain-containing protein [bacterium]|nr:NACHT domain-containing protein [bacterium]
MQKFFNPSSISRINKEEFLLGYSEDDFRDLIIRPLFLEKGFRDGRELCGPLEEGKDTLFTETDKLGQNLFYAVQTKKGHLNMAAKASNNVNNAIAQLRTALEVKIPLISSKKNIYPDQVMLCASGKINTTARKHIVDEIKDPRIRFMDCDDLIPMLDDVMPELWFGVNLEKFPYLSNLHSSLTSPTSELKSGFSENEDPFYCPVTNDNFVNIKFNRLRIKSSGNSDIKDIEPDFEELSVKQLIDSDHKKILITGEAGSGKSTAIRRMLCICAEIGMKTTDEIVVPVFIRAKELLGIKTSLEIVLANKTSEMTKNKVVAFSKEDLEKGNVQIFIDGLDEVANQDERIQVVKLLNGFQQKYKSCKFYLSSRNYKWLESIPDIAQWIRYRISPIDWKQTTQIVKRLKKSKSLSEDQIQDILRRLQDVHGLQLNPLLISVFVSSADYSRKDIPANITEIMKKYTEMMLGRWDTSKGFAQQHEAPLKDFLIQALAYQLHLNRSTSVSLDGFTNYLEEELKKRGKTADIKTLTEEIVYRSGLFRIVGEEIEFAHLMVQEFFAGRFLDDEDVLSLVTDDWWQRAIVFHAGSNPNNISLLRNLSEHLSALSSEDRNNALLTLGLSLQANYLVEVEQKVGIHCTILQLLAHDTTNLFSKHEKEKEKKLFPFIRFYLLYRDAVSCDIQTLEEKKIKSIVSKTIDVADIDALEFWQIVGLMETGAFDQVLQRLKNYSPSDTRFFLGAHLGAFFFQIMRTSNKAERRKINKILTYLAPKIHTLRLQLKQEYASELLELRKGKIVSINESTELLE